MHDIAPETERKLFELARRLIPATQEGRVDWGETIDEERFRASLGSGMIHIQKNKHSRNTHLLRICNESGHICFEHTSQGDEFRQLYELVRFRVLRTDVILDEMLADLKEKALKNVG